MGHSFVSINEFGFWVHDSLLEPWLRLLALHLAEPTDQDAPSVHSTTKEIRDQWLLASKGYFGGWIPVELDKAVATDEGRIRVRAATESLLDALTKAPKMLRRDMLNLLSFADGTYTFDIESRRLIEVGRAFLDLIDGKVISKAGDGAKMPGSS